MPAAPPPAEASPDDDLLMELARIVSETVPQEGAPPAPVRRPPVLIAPRRPIGPNTRPLPSERAAMAARAAAAASAAPAMPASDLAPTEAAPEGVGVISEATAAAAPEPEPEIDEFERALSAELGEAPTRPRAMPDATVTPSAAVPAAPAAPVAVLHRGSAPVVEARADAPMRPAAPVVPPRPTVEDLAAALSFELDIAPEPAPAAGAQPAARSPSGQPSQPAGGEAEAAKPPLPPTSEEAASDDEEAERSRRLAEREMRREQRRAARASRREAGAPEDGDTPAVVDGPPGGRGFQADAAPKPADGAVGKGAPLAAQGGEAGFDFAAFEAEIRATFTDPPKAEAAAGPKPSESGGTAVAISKPAAPQPVIPKPAIPKPAGLAPLPVPGRPGESPATVPPALAVEPASARAPAADPRTPRPPLPAAGDDFELDLLEGEPGYSVDDMLPPHSDAEQRALRLTTRRRRRPPLVALMAAAAVVLVAGGAAAWWLLAPTATEGPPPVIQADGEPVKIEPPAAEARDAGESGKAFYDRVTEAGDPARQVIDPEGRQTIDLPIAGSEPTDPALPGVTANDDDPLAALTADPNAPPEAAEPEPAEAMAPKRVRTVVVRPDGTIVPQADLPTTVTAEPQPPPAAGLAPSQPADAAVSPPSAGAAADVSSAADAAALPAATEPGALSTDPAYATAEQPTDAESLAGAIGYPMPRRKPLVFDEPTGPQTMARPTSNLPDPLPAAEGVEAKPVFGSAQGVNSGATGSAADAASAALTRGTDSGETVAAAAPAPAVPEATPAPAAVPAPATAAAAETAAAAPATVPSPPVDAAPEPAAASTVEPATQAVATTPVRVTTLPTARQAPPPVEAAPATAPAPVRTAAATIPEAPAPVAPAAATAAPAAPASTAGRSARILPPAGTGTNPFAAATPAPAAPAPVAPVAAAPEPVAATPPSAAPAPSGGGSYAVQLASQKSDAEARAAYAGLQRRFPSILGGRAPVIQSADVGTRGTFYRVRLPFGSSAEANRLCNDLKAAGGDCFVGRN
jgi:hypothetical protein